MCVNIMRDSVVTLLRAAVGLEDCLHMFSLA